MNDVYVEQIVKKKPEKWSYLVEAICVILCFVLLATVYSAIGVILLVAMIAATYFVFRYFKVEYEYLLISDELNIDKITARTSRKRVASYDMNKLEVIAKEESEELRVYDDRNLKVFDFTSNTVKTGRTVMVIMDNNELVKVYIEPNARIIEGIKLTAPRKVKL